MATKKKPTVANYKATSNDSINVTLFLLTAANEGVVRKLAQALIDSGIDINAKDVCGKTALHYSAIEGHVHHVKVLIAAGLNIHEKDKNGYTPLHDSAESGHLDAMKILLGAGADINAKTNCGKTLLHISSDSGSVDVVKYLIAEGVSVKSEDKDGFTALHCSAKKGHSDVMKILMAAGADIDAKNNSGKTPLIGNAADAQSVMLKYLFASAGGADNNSQTYCPRLFTPLHLSINHNHLDAVKVLIAAGADVNAEDELGITPLQDAARQGNLKVVKALLAAGANVKAQQKLCLSNALHECAETHNVEIIKALIAAGIDINVKDSRGYTPLFLARTFDQMENCKVLIKHIILRDPGSKAIRNIPQPEKLLGHWKACRLQVLKMKKMKLGDSSVSFYDFLTETDKNKVVFYSSVEIFGIGNKAKRAQYKEEFHIYAENIEDQYKKGKVRAGFLNKSTNLMTCCFCKKLPIDVGRKISEYLSNEDLISFLFSPKCNDGPGAPVDKKK